MFRRLQKMLGLRSSECIDFFSYVRLRLGRAALKSLCMSSKRYSKTGSLRLTKPCRDRDFSTFDRKGDCPGMYKRRHSYCIYICHGLGMCSSFAKLDQRCSQKGLCASIESLVRKLTYWPIAVETCYPRASWFSLSRIVSQAGRRQQKRLHLGHVY